MGFSVKKLGNLAGKALGAAGGAYFGGPAGAAAGYTGADAVLGVVGLGDDQLAAKENLAMQKEMADYKYAQDMNMWNLVNAYNDPAAQMERLQKAGLNPNLVYGGGNVTGNASSSGPEYASINAGYTDRSVQRKQLALALEEHQQRITNQAIENDLARQRLILAERDADRSDALAQAQIIALKANLGLTAARISDIEYQHDQPKTWLGKYVIDTAHGLSLLPEPEHKGSHAQQTKFIQDRVNSYNKKFKKGFYK